MKYKKLFNIKNDEPTLLEGENLIWKDKPKKSCFLLSNVMVMVPFVLVWIIADGFLIISILSSMTAEFKKGAPIYGLFITVHLMPVWMWLSEILASNKEWKNTEYYITDKRIIVKNGLNSGKKESIYYKDVVDVKMQVDKFDKFFGVGEIYIKTTNGIVSFMDVKDSKEVLTKLQNIVKEAQKDMSTSNIYGKKNKQNNNEK